MRPRAAAQATTLLPEPPALRSIVMADASGQRFNCSIPTSPSGAGTALAAQQPVRVLARLQQHDSRVHRCRRAGLTCTFDQRTPLLLLVQDFSEHFSVAKSPFELLEALSERATCLSACTVVRIAAALPSTLMPAAAPHAVFAALVAAAALCLYHKDGLWTYEVCHRKHVRQFRQVSGAAWQAGRGHAGLQAATTRAAAISHQLRGGRGNR